MGFRNVGPAALVSMSEWTKTERRHRCPSQKQDWLLFKLVSAVTLVFERLKYLCFIAYDKEWYQGHEMGHWLYTLRDSQCTRTRLGSLACQFSQRSPNPAHVSFFTFLE